MDEATKNYFRRKIKTAEELRQIIGPPPRERKVIMCHGVFDVVHPGHIRHLIYAKSKGEILVTSLTADEHIMKGNMRPYVPEDLRAINLAALEMVDYVVIDHDATPLRNLGFLQPDYFAKGYEYVNGGVHPKTQEEVRLLESYGGEVIFTPGDIVYSSTHITNLAPPTISVEKLMMLMDAEKVTFDDLRRTLDAMPGTAVHVVGDTIVDSFSHCSMIGGMTKTPTMSVRFESRTDFVGGAGIVCKHLRAAGAEVVFSTVLGDDRDKDFVLADLDKAGIKVRAIIDPTRPTTNKNAIVTGGYRLLKIDTLDNRSISERILHQLSDTLHSAAADVVVFSDFRHGIFNRQTTRSLIDAIPAKAFRVADSQVASRWGNILEFTGFDLITPNEREARFSLGDQDSTVRPLATQLYNRAECKTLILKLGERGIITQRSNAKHDPRAFFAIDSFVEHVVDAVGAGDALLAYASLAQRASGNAIIASILGSFAAGLECERDGNLPITPDDVRGKIRAVEKLARYG